MRVAALQHDICYEDAGATRARLAPLIAQAAAAGAELIVLAEMFATGFSMHPERIAEDEGGPTEAFLLDNARAHGAHLIASIAQRGDDGAYRNNAVVAAPDGTVRRYSKIHPFSYAGEHEHYEAGSDHLTVGIGGLRVSVFVCYDLRFADEFWAVAPDTDLYVVPANWPRTRRDHWRALLRARAIENQAYVVGVNRVGRAPGEGRELDYAGDCAILDPMGAALAEASEVETILMADVTAARVRDVRARFPFLADRRQVVQRNA